MRNYRTTIILLLSLAICIPALAAGDTASPALTITVTTNETPFFSTGLFGGRAPAEYHQPDPSITLFHVELQETEYPGPRDMAFGPRYIQLTTNLNTLVILGIAACVAVLVFAVCRRRKAVADAGGASENIPENDDEKQI